MADFRQLAEWLRRLTPAMVRAGGSRVPSGVGQVRPAFPIATPGTAMIGAAEGGMQPHPVALNFLRRLNEEKYGRREFRDDELLAALAYQLGEYYGPFAQPTSPPRR